MMTGGILSLIPLLVGLAAFQDGGVQQQVRRLVVGNEIIVRVPVQPKSVSRRFVWAERRGPKCISTRSIRGALLSGPDHVDFMLIARQRVRAHFDDDCPALDFYGGFYLKPQDDRICADRDFIHSRIGGSCQIQGFGLLVPKVRVPANP